MAWQIMVYYQQIIYPKEFISSLKEGRAGQLLDLVLRMDDEAGTIAFAVQTKESRQWVEGALGDAFSALDGRFSRKAGVGRNPLCLVVAIAVESIQQQFAGAKATR